MFVIEQPIPPAPAADSKANVLTEHFENCSPYEMVHELKAMFEKQARVESVGLILNGLTSDFVGFVRNYNMHNMGKTIGELHAMLIEYEKGLPKKSETPQIMMIKSGKIEKANKKLCKAKGKGKSNGKGNDKHIPKPKNSKPAAKEHPTKDDTCHHRKEVGHWKMNYLVYLAELLKKQKLVGTASSSGIFTIELFSFPNKSWVYDTRCATHFCITKQGFREARKLKQGALYLYVGNGVHAQVEAIGSYDLVLPNGLVFNNEVENQLGKAIKALYSDRGGEYISQEFKDYLKACRIVQQLTPPYTPQHNRVFERRNRTLLDLEEAEYIAALEATMKVVWIRKFISELGIVPTINEPIKMFCDNSTTLLIANEPGVQRGARHYHKRYHYVRECIELGEINLFKVHTDDNLADPFTKALSKGKLTQTC
ncbi:retrotransposon protein, putative, ty1-copia subclass [Tanacetum coccineum]|uniref:Retrotransposon protein, putative, ty1-copia subclass n=1 Tax=Tanacetum coccineum TaxID=301880 RepID=A0ABQ4YDV9_9ASTR